MTNPVLRLSVVAVMSLPIVMMAQASPRFGGPRAGRAAAPFPPGARGAALQSEVLRPRDLVNKELDERTQRKYDTAVLPLKKKAEAEAARAEKPNPAARIAAYLRLGSTQLKFDQEVEAADAFESAWLALAEAVQSDPKSAGSLVNQMRAHLRELGQSAARDPAMVLAFMGNLSQPQQDIDAAIEDVKIRKPYAMAVALVWLELLNRGDVGKEAVAQASHWLIQFPDMATSDRPLSEQARGDLQSQLTYIRARPDILARDLVFTQISGARLPNPQTGRRADQLQPGIIPPEQADSREYDLTLYPDVARAIQAMDEKRATLVDFAEAEVYFEYGQFREASRATGHAWEELLQYYRHNRHNMTPMDIKLHTDTLDKLVDRNAVQAVFLVSDLDTLYRQYATLDPAFTSRVADMWFRLSGAVKLPAEPLAKAVYWIEQAGKQQKDLQTRYLNILQDLKDQLAEAREKENVAAGKKGRDVEERQGKHKEAGESEDGDDKGKDAKDGDKDEKENDK